MLHSSGPMADVVDENSDFKLPHSISECEVVYVESSKHLAWYLVATLANVMTTICLFLLPHNSSTSVILSLVYSLWALLTFKALEVAQKKRMAKYAILSIASNDYCTTYEETLVSLDLMQSKVKVSKHEYLRIKWQLNKMHSK